MLNAAIEELLESIETGHFSIINAASILGSFTCARPVVQQKT